MSQNQDSDADRIARMEDIGYLEGKLHTLVEGMGLPEKREEAYKDMVRTIVWNWFDHLNKSSN